MVTAHLEEDGEEASQKYDEEQAVAELGPSLQVNTPVPTARPSFSTSRTNESRPVTYGSK